MAVNPPNAEGAPKVGKVESSAGTK